MKVLLFNGSTRNNGCTYLALDQVAQILRQAGIETELLQLGGQACPRLPGLQSLRRERPVRFLRGRSQPLIRKARQADGFVFGSPVYFAHPTGQMLAVMDRLFYAGGDAFAHKPAAAVVTARRAGTTASPRCAHQALHQCPNAGGVLHLLNMVFGPAPEQAVLDQEGLQTMRNLGRNLAWLLPMHPGRTGARSSAPGS